MHLSGDHEGAWRLPSSPVERITDPGYFAELAETVSRGGFDAVFFPDFVGYDPLVRSVVRWPHEPTTLAAALLQRVPDLGVIVTASTVFATPDQLYRTFHTLGELSGGRIGWNIVTAGSPSVATAIGGDPVPPHDERYRKAGGIIDDLLRRWGSTRPVLAQAGASPAGRDFAARYAEVVFTATPSKSEAIAFRSDLRRRAIGFGRDPDEIRVLPGILTVLGATDDDARALHDRLGALVTEHAARHMLGMYGVDLPAEGLDARLDRVTSSPGHDGILSRAAVLDGIAAQLGQASTWRDLVNRIAGSRGHLSVTGSGQTVAAAMNDWLTDGACDGFVVKFAHSPGGADDFVRTVSPLLTSRGIGSRAGWSGIRTTV
ncbi:putative FMNH2-dependent monooxygenase [Gordonia soli NBRC 108243]|uniref:Putative FMNH2-dependent monooxygenase n=2 Tax=Gordonia soli TaxID=320799 RepID=M0QRK0_9ACTN|nr:putative FMNH2-dependent monooxygenase [Gordonia soli NBRC 108243]